MADAPLAIIKVNELLKEVSVNYSRTRVVEAVIASVRETLLGLSDEEVSGSLASAFVKDLGVPEGKARFTFKKPESVEVVGSYATQTVAKPLQHVDLAVRIPKSCFHEKDYLKHRYHAKRAIYLAVLEKHLQSCPRIKSVQWSCFQQDARKPVLLLHPGRDDSRASTKFLICVLPTVSPEVFDISKLAPSRNNVRDAKTQEGLAQPTPHYNTSILEDLVLENNSTWLQKSLEVGALREAVLLMKVWSRQRSLQGNADNMNGFLWAMLLAHLISSGGGKCITQHMTALQIFRVTMDAIANGNVLGKGVFIENDSVTLLASEVKKALLRSFEMVMYDPSGRMNLASRMTKSALSELKEEATRTLTAMKGSKDEGFDVLFMTPVDYATKFDYHVRVSTTEEVNTVPSSSRYCLNEDSWRTYKRRVESLLWQGLGDRARIVRVLSQNLPPDWALDQGFAKTRGLVLHAGILVSNLDVALRMADVGPSADNKAEAQKFRAFWGNRAELRRFKDGTITETADSVHVVAGQLDYALLEKGKDPMAVMPKLLEAFEILSKRLRSMEDLPLQVVSVQPISAAFRHTDVFPPQPHPLAEATGPQKIPLKAVSGFVEPLEVVIQLEGSGKWPDESQAIQKTKSAFCLQIAQSMQKRWGVGCVAAEDAVDVMMEGFVFRLRVLYEKDPAWPSSKALKELESTPVKIGLLQSSHASLLQGLHGIYPAYGPTVRLAKRWVASHFFSGAVANEAVELLVAYLFVKPAPHAAPSSRVTGFLRFLRLLVSHDWALSPIVVDVNGDLTLGDHDSIMAQFDAEREELPSSANEATPKESGGSAMYIATPYDLGSKAWTHDAPSALVLKRLVAYAKSSADLISRLIRGEEDDNRWLSIFRTPVTCYDAIIQLHPESLPYPGRVLFPPDVQSKATIVKPPPAEPLTWLSPLLLKLGSKSAREHLLIGFNPMEEFVRELKVHHGEMCKPWYDGIGSNFMALTFTLSAIKAKSSKRKRAKNGNSTIDLKRFLNEIAISGDGLVKSIHLRPG